MKVFKSIILFIIFVIIITAAMFFQYKTADKQTNSDTTNDETHTVAVKVFSEPQKDKYSILSTLPTLRKHHYTWPLWDSSLKEINYDVLKDYAKITHSLSISQWNSENVAKNIIFPIIYEINIEIEEKKKIGDYDPERDLECVLCIQYSPYNSAYWRKSRDATDFGPEYDKEINNQTQFFKNIKRWIYEFSKKGGDIKVDVIFLDSETFYASDEEQIIGISKKHMATYKIAHQFFPDAKIDWFGKGAWLPAPIPSGWQKYPRLVGTELGNSYCVPLYRPGEFFLMKESFSRTCKYAEKNDINTVNIIISFGSGYKRSKQNINGSWTFNYEYDVFYSWFLGYQIHNPWFSRYPERFAPWNMIDHIFIYPPIFDQRSPSALDHFVEYVKGSNSIKQ